MTELDRFSIGIGDRFARQGKAQLQALIHARDAGVHVVPVWNKSNREHTIIGTTHADVRREADEAVRSLGWTAAYFVDADHIGLKTVDGFIPHSDFFTLDVADVTGKAAPEADILDFVTRHGRRIGSLRVPGINRAFRVTRKRIDQIARKYLLAVREAGRIYRHVAAAKGNAGFVTEVSMDETDEPQTPVELFFILAAIADEKIPAQTIAPKFTGRFNKGVDYVGDLKQFAREFHEDVCVVQFAAREFGLPASLKLSVHSGSDKFSLYPIMNRALRKRAAGLHLKTAGTTWLEELIGLAASDGEGLTIAREVYRRAFDRFDELCAPYATVIDIGKDRLPAPDTVNAWSAAQFVAALRHDPANPAFNPDVRQLLHVGYKVAAEMKDRYLNALRSCETVIAGNVTTNLYDRHIRPIFGGISS